MAQNRGVFRLLGASTLTLAIVLGVPSLASAQAIDAGAVFRVFLTSGQALASYGESAVVGDRVVFTLLVGVPNGQPALQLMSLPKTAVDLERTVGYARSMRARHYAATRGEVDYAAMRLEAQRALEQVTGTTDPKKRVELAEEARRRLVAWSEGTYGFRAAEVRELIALFDDAIRELRSSAGERGITLDLRAGPPEPGPETLLEPPALTESIDLALRAAQLADTEEDRLAILRTAAAVTSADPSAGELNARVVRELRAEQTATESYVALADEVRKQADAARRRGDVSGVESAIAVLHVRDRELGSRRPERVTVVATELDGMLAAARAHRRALERYAQVRRLLLEYERTMRPTMSGFDGLLPILKAVEEQRFTAYERLEAAGARLRAFQGTTRAVTPPEDLADVHATLLSALQMAEHAVARRRLAVSTGNETFTREASSAAAGAIMLAGLAREQLVARLYPPKID
jgi:hypothetical protein